MLATDYGALISISRRASELVPVKLATFDALAFGGAGGRVVGVVGVIGPTRLNYARIVPMVDYTSKLLARVVARG